MPDISIEADEFGRTVEQLLGRLATGVESETPEAVEQALDAGEKAWKKNARSVLSKSYSRGGWGKRKQTYTPTGRKSKRVEWYGKTFKTGKYARSIRHQMLQSGELTEGEIGSSSMPGLAHLLEKGHALVGGGSAKAFVHIEPAAEQAFKDFEKYIDQAIDRAIDDV